MAEITEHKHRRVRWSLGATFIALALWGVLSMSQSYSWDIDVPLEVRLDTTEETLVESIPRTIRVTARADGWTLMQIALGNDPRCLLTPAGRPTSSNDSIKVYSYNEREILSAIYNSINIASTLQLEDPFPNDLKVTITNLATKQVPLYYPEFSIDTRDGFQVIGTPRVSPDSVRLSGPAETLKNISHWYTTPLKLNDVFRPVLTTVPVSDTLYSVISVYPDVAMVQAEVQEVAELTLEDLPIINRGRFADTTTRLLLYPSRVTITLRGGADELGRLSEGDVVPYVQLNPDVDSSGFVRPRISLPGRGNASVIAVKPARVRFVWRKMIETTGDK